MSNIHVNLMPNSYRRRVVAYECVRTWSWVWIACVVAGAFLVVVRYHDANGAQSKLVGVRKTYGPTAKLLREVQEMRDKMEQLQEVEAVSNELTERQPALTLLTSVSHSAAKTHGDLHVDSMDWKRDVAKGQRPRLIVSGRAISFPAITLFAEGLREAGLFRKVDLKETQFETVLGVKTYRYTLQCECR